MTDPRPQMSWTRRRVTLLALAACLPALTMLTLAQPAQAELSFCEPGSGAGQCSDPRGVATEFDIDGEGPGKEGRLYVADRGNNRVDAFEPDGDFLFAFGWDVIPSGAPGDTGTGFEKCTTASGCQAGSGGSGAGELLRPTRIAVDNVTGSAARHDIYVVTTNFRWQRFKADGSFVHAVGWGVDTGAAKLEVCTTGSICQSGIKGGGECQLNDADVANVDPVAIGPSGNVFIADTAGSEPNFTDRVEKFNPEGACLGETTLIVGGNARLFSLAVDVNEDAFVSVDGQGQQLFKYDLDSPETKLCDLDPGIGTQALALDDSGHLYAAQDEPGAKGGRYNVITEYETSCSPTKHIRRFGYGKLQGRSFGVAAFSSADGDVFAVEPSKGINYLDFPPPGPIIAPPSFKASPVRSVWASIVAEINPEGKATEYEVEWVEEESFETEGGFASPKTKTSGLVSLGATDFRVHFAEAVAGCKPFSEAALEEGKCLKPETAYRYRLVAENADGKDELEGQFTTRPPLEVEQSYPSDPGTDAMTLNAVVNPLGSLATGYFEYVEEATFQESGFASASQLPDVKGGQAPLDFGSGEEGVKRSAVLSPLPPGTSYRLRLIVTDPFATITGPERSFTTFKQPEPEACPANEAFREGASALLPDCRAYELVSPLDKQGGDIFVKLEGYTRQPAVLSQSAVSGERVAYGSYRSFGDAESSPYTTQYIASREVDGWQSHAITPPLSTEVPPVVISFDNEVRTLSPDLCEAWVTPFTDVELAEGAIPGWRNLYRRTDELCGGKPDYETLAPAKAENLQPSLLFEHQGHSADGSVTAFAANDTLEESGAPLQPPACNDILLSACRIQLYVRGVGGLPRYACILPGGAPHKGSCSAGSGAQVFAKNRLAGLAGALSADGTKLFWTAAQAEGRIYHRTNPLAEGAECAEEASPCTTDVSKAGEEASGTTASSFQGAAPDGSKAIFTTANDLYEFTVQGSVTHKVAGGVSRVLGASEDISRIYFASTEVLSGEEANSEGDKAQAGKSNLYLYEAGGGGGYRFIATLDSADQRVARITPDGEQIAFMSAAPLTGYDNTDASSGKADAEVFLYDAGANGGSGELLCASCNPSGARPAGVLFNKGADEGNPFWGAARLQIPQTNLYSSRQLSEDGSRLFFEAQDALSPLDTNGRIDVYQWEREGKGGCTAQSPSFSSEAAGCIELISSGQSKRDAEFLDASPSGNDAFFVTLSSLLPQDYGLLDVYDARAGGGLPTPPTPAPECEGETCQSPSAAPEFGTPATSTYRGPGNLDEAASKPKPRSCPKGRRKVSKGGRKRCVPKAKRHKRAKGSGRASR